MINTHQYIFSPQKNGQTGSEVDSGSSSQLKEKLIKSRFNNNNKKKVTDSSKQPVSLSVWSFFLSDTWIGTSATGLEESEGG